MTGGSPVVSDADQSALLRDRLRGEIAGIASADLAANWARGVLTSKNSLTAADAKLAEDAFERRLSGLSESSNSEHPIEDDVSAATRVARFRKARATSTTNDYSRGIDKSVLTVGPLGAGTVQPGLGIHLLLTLGHHWCAWDPCKPLQVFTSEKGIFPNGVLNLASCLVAGRITVQVSEGRATPFEGRSLGPSGYNFSTVLALRRTRLDQVPADAHLEDYTVRNNGEAVGRLYQVRAPAVPELAWFWSITTYVDPRAEVKINGPAADLATAKAAFRASWREWLNWKPKPDSTLARADPPDSMNTHEQQSFERRGAAPATWAARGLRIVPSTKPWARSARGAGGPSASAARLPTLDGPLVGAQSRTALSGPSVQADRPAALPIDGGCLRLHGPMRRRRGAGRLRMDARATGQLARRRGFKSDCRSAPARRGNDGPGLPTTNRPRRVMTDQSYQKLDGLRPWLV